MKRKFFLPGLMVLALALSCNKEPERVKSVRDITGHADNSAREMFRLALNEMNLPKYAPSKEYMEKHGDELSQERKNILLGPAISLIYSVGISEQDLAAETNGDIDLILKKAFNIYISQPTLKNQ